MRSSAASLGVWGLAPIPEKERKKIRLTQWLRKRVVIPHAQSLVIGERERGRLDCLVVRSWYWYWVSG